MDMPHHQEAAAVDGKAARRDTDERQGVASVPEPMY